MVHKKGHIIQVVREQLTKHRPTQCMGTKDFAKQGVGEMEKRQKYQSNGEGILHCAVKGQ